MNTQELKTLLPFIELPFIEVLLAQGSIMKVNAGEALIKQDGYIPGLPVVLEGSIKVYTTYDDKSLLLYYIGAGQSCVMSFSSCLKGTPSQIHATTEKESLILLLPIPKIESWLKQYPSFNTLFYAQFDMRYKDLLTNIQQLLFQKLDTRLLDYLIKKQAVLGNVAFKITHQEIATDLGTAREVISRTLKKLENEGLVTHTKDGFLVL